LLAGLSTEVAIQHEILSAEAYISDSTVEMVCIDRKNETVIPITLQRAYHIHELEQRVDQAAQNTLRQQISEPYDKYLRHPGIGISFFGKNLVLKETASNTMIPRIESLLTKRKRNAP
jgi:hypothetical protein